MRPQGSLAWCLSFPLTRGRCLSEHTQCIPSKGSAPPPQPGDYPQILLSSQMALSMEEMMLSFSRSQACQRQPGQEDLSLQPEVLGSLSSLLSLQSTHCKASVAPGRVLGSIEGQDGSNCLLAPLIAHPLRGPGCWGCLLVCAFLGLCYRDML